MNNALFCLPCLLFSDAAMRGEHQRLNQGNAFTVKGFNNWKIQYSAVIRHENSSAHRSAAVAQALFLQLKTIDHSIAKASSERSIEVARNRAVLERIVDAVMFLGHQGLSFRGHRETIV